MASTKPYPSSLQADDLPAETIVEHYFSSFNAGDFDATAALFAIDGALHPPFESAIVGTAAIAQYLKAEAEGMQAYPEMLEVTQTDASSRRILVKGRVKALVFKVNVAWTFEIDETEQIRSAEIKLLASMQELLSLRP
ncbi:nuclear transport factor 2 family protein [Halomicronema sp. CCY15110]|uniref:nuclear transport factor 2 family protein n=1 Tax=Halomicronema sp. CCY15110 TaxID=2767773 RepID=UPI00194EDCA1|nr:nuclear transport factor 2 family protein [Halomicronema sp. CCY15110]